MQRSPWIARRRRITAKYTSEQDERDSLFLAVAPTVIAAVEIGWLPPGYAGPAIRLEYLRLLNGRDPVEWAKQADVPPNTLQHWRSSRTMSDAFGNKGKSTRLYLSRLLKHLKQSAELAWVLAGSGPTAKTPTLANRATLVLGILEGVKDGKELDEDLACQRLGIASFSIFEKDTTSSACKAAINMLSEASKPWCSSPWLRKGSATSPAAITKLKRQLRRGSGPGYVPLWAELAKQPVTISLRLDPAIEMTRVEALVQVRVIQECAGLDNRLRRAVLSALSVADLPGLTCGGQTCEPLSVEGFLEIAPGLLAAAAPHLQLPRQKGTKRPVPPRRQVK